MKVVIRAGGVGTRLWPFSRASRPKQFCALSGGRTMIQDAVDRVADLVTPDDLFVSTGTAHVGLVRDQVPAVAEDHIIVEPALRNTGPAVGLECVLLDGREKNCIVASLGSDHHIGKPDVFRDLLRTAETALKDDPKTLFTIGVRPTRPETGYGYIQKGHVRREVGGTPVYAVDSFKEKPDETVAREYVDSGRYLWNSNMFVWRVDTMLALFEKHTPELFKQLMTIREAVGTAKEAEVIQAVYPEMEEIAIDNAIIEKAPDVSTLEADIDWSDIGSWGALTDVLPVDEDGNLLSGDVISLGAKNVTVYGGAKKVIAMVDVEDLVVVDTEDALLVCRRDGAQRVRDVVGALKERGGDHA